jgi:hypothetical protein
MNARANTMINSGATIERLDPAAIYRAPSGRLCRVYAVQGKEVMVAQLRYVASRRHGAAEWGDGFCLTRENWRILQLVAT